MSAKVHLHLWPIWGHAPSRVHDAIDWRPSLAPVELVPEEMISSPGLAVHLNGRPISAHEMGLIDLAPGDHVDVGLRPAEVATITAALVSSAVSAGVSLVLSMLLPKPKGPKRKGDNESPTYGFDGKDNVRVEGQPRQVIYGEIRVAPQVADQYVKTTTVPPRTDLYLLLALGEGPIHSIGSVTSDNPIDTPLSASNPSYPLPTGIEINGNPAENFRGIEAHVRLGTNEQLPIPGFQEIHTVSEVGSTLTQQETSASSNIGTAWTLTTFPYNSNDSSVQAIWTSYAQSFDTPDVADAYTLTVTFPDGLYRIDSNGNLQDAYFQALVRYRELDGGGSPITTGGDNGDGWVYAPPIPRLVSRHQGQFSHELSGIFYTPTGYSPGVQGRILQCDSTGMYARTAGSDGGAAQNAVTPWSTAQAIDEFAWVGWVKPASLPDTGTGTAKVRPIFEWLTTGGGTERGFAVHLQRITVDVGSDSTQERWRLRTYWSDGSNQRSFDDVSSSPFQAGFTRFSTVRWYHIAVTYKRNASGGNDRWRIYVDGSLAREFMAPSNQDMLAPLAPFYLARANLANTGSGTVEGFMRLDEVAIWRKELTAAQVAASYNLGVGTFGTTGSDLVAGWHFDLQDNVVNFTFASGFVTNNNKITVVGGGVTGESTTQLDAPVFRPGSGTLKRARYRVQLMRFNLKSNSTAILDSSTWESMDSRVAEELAYPNTPLLALKIPATEQLNTTTPTVTVLVKGRKVPVWDRISTDVPSFTDTWSSSPAWVLYDMLTNRRFGRGGDFDSSNVDLVSFSEWADYCDELVYDQLGTTAVHESTGTAPIQTMQYDSTLNSGFGGIDVFFRLGFTPSALWKAGGYIGFRGLPTPPTVGITVDINVGNISGFEIADVFFNGGVWVVRLKYDKATYGDPWADGSFLETVTSTTINGTAEGRETRCRFDGVFDTFSKPWDAMLQVASCGRAMPALDGSRVRVRVSKPRSPSFFVGMGSIEPGTFKVEYSNPLDRTNVYVSDILSRDNGYKSKPVQRSSPELDEGALESAINRENVELLGVTRISQANRDLDFRLNVNRLLARQGEFTTGIEGLLYEAGDVGVLAHDIVPWGISGRFHADQSGASITVDREIVIGARTHYVRVRMNSIGQTGSGSSVADYMEVRQITAASATYAAGASISIASAFTVAPKKGDPFLIYEESEQFLVEIAETTSTPDFKRRVRWVEYDEDTFDVDEPSIAAAQEGLIIGASALTLGSVAPEPVGSVTLREGQRMSAQGVYRTDVTLSWSLGSETADAVESVAIWMRLANDSSSAWEEAARVNGKATSTTLRLTNDTPGTALDFAIQPTSRGGARLDVEDCARISHTLAGTATKPPAPARLNAIFAGDQVTYRWTPPANSRGLSYELRRGCWMLGQVIGTAPPGSTSFGPTSNWSAGKSNLRGDPPPIVYIRARDSRGQYSDAAICENFNPSVEGATLMIPPYVVGKLFNGDACWEDFGTGWESAAPGPYDPTLTNVEVATDDIGRSVLRFSGSATGGAYQTSNYLVPANSRPERCYVEAYIVGVQIPPLEMGDWTLPLGDPLCASRTMEGVLGASGCTLTIEWRYTTSGSGSFNEWRAFVPGIYVLVVPQFRLILTRPDTTWQVHIQRFGTRLSRAPKQRFETDDTTAHFTAARSF